jgi:hypothetical protein
VYTAVKDKSVTGLTNASTQILASNPGRCYLLICNTNATVDCWVSLTGGTAAANTAGSIRLAANGGSYEGTGGTFCPTNKITAISAGANINLTVLESG